MIYEVSKGSKIHFFRPVIPWGNLQFQCSPDRLDNGQGAPCAFKLRPSPSSLEIRTLGPRFHGSYFTELAILLKSSVIIHHTSLKPISITSRQHRTGDGVNQIINTLYSQSNFTHIQYQSTVRNCDIFDSTSTTIMTMKTLFTNNVT